MQAVNDNIKIQVFLFFADKCTSICILNVTYSQFFNKCDVPIEYE